MKFLFEVRMRPGVPAERYAEAWVRASEIIQRAPGARGTRLHRRIGEPGRLIAIAEWDSKADRDAARGIHPEADAIIAAAAEFCDVTILGEYEDPEWVVIPERGSVHS